ncbi:MAG: efflux RND transporter periplasmic adaptor subunit [Gemmatimonadota bacterium]|nr:efflux RND transporter periplasmic adaptor subunit [Gemmatimonadota bacterium]
MFSRRRLLPFLASLVVLGALYAGYRQIASRPPLVEVTEARTEDVVRVLAVTGRIRPRLTSRVQPLVSGTVLTLTRAEGATVRRGDVLATLDAQTSRAVIEQATAQLRARRTEAEQLARDCERTRRLADAGGLAQREAEAAESELEAARESVRQLEALLREAVSRARDFVLVSPIDGYVLSRPIDPGQNVTPQTVVYELASAVGAEVEVEIDEQFLSELRLGLEATVSPLTGERRQYAASLVTIGRRVSESSGAVPVRLAFVAEAPPLPAGLSVDVNLMIARHPAATTVSRAAVAGLGADPYVLLVRNDTLVRQPLQVIDWPSPRIVVIRGVAAGDRVVLTPRLVRAGMTVRTKPAADAF